jgi:hypothetical protein
LGSFIRIGCFHDDDETKMQEGENLIVLYYDFGRMDEISDVIKEEKMRQNASQNSRSATRLGVLQDSRVLRSIDPCQSKKNPKPSLSGTPSPSKPGAGRELFL